MIAQIVTRYRELERLYLQRTKSELELMLEKALIRLYAEILTYLARAVRPPSEKSIGEFHFLHLMFSWEILRFRSKVREGALLQNFTIRSLPCPVLGVTTNPTMRESTTIMNRKGV